MNIGSIRLCRRHRNGFSLLEIVLALAIVAVAMSLLAQLVGVANRAAAAARDQTKAQLVAESIMAEFAAGVMLPADTVGEWEADPTWSYEAVVLPDVATNVSSITVTATHNVDAVRPASFSMTQWLFIEPEPVEEETEASTTTSGAGAMMNRMTRPRRRGFTLLETILAVALSAVLMGLIVAGLQMYTRIVANSNADVVNAQLARAVLQQISADVRAAIYEEPEEDTSLSAEGGAEGESLGATAESTSTGSISAGTTATNSGTASGEGDDATTSEGSLDLTSSTVASVPGVFGNQTELRIDVRGPFAHPLRYDSLVESGGDPLLDNLVSVDRVVTYYLRNSSPGELAGTPLEAPTTSDQSQDAMILVRRIQKRAEAELEAAIGGTGSIQFGEQLLSDQVVGLEFAYHDGYDWTESWDSEEMGGLPIAIQVTVTVSDSTDPNAVITADNVFQMSIAITNSSDSRRYHEHGVLMMNSKSRTSRRGVALLMVMVLIVMISLGVYSFAQLMTAQETATVMNGRRVQAKAAVAAGVEYLKDYVIIAPEDQAALGGHWDNPSYFNDIVVGGPAQGETRFSIISIVEDNFGEPTGVRYGLTDESSKLNVNFLATEAYGPNNAMDSLDELADVPEPDDAVEAMIEETGQGREALLSLPGMTETIADSILDWIDADDEPRDFGTEAGGYAGLGYEPRNGPISSIDELLLIQGVTNELLYGADRNHNGILDSNEQDAVVGSGTGSMSRGWSAYLTTHSQDAVEQAEETVDLNQDDLQTLHDELIAAGFELDFANYVVVYRQSGPYEVAIPEDAADDFELPEPQSIAGLQPDLSQSGETKIESVLDLLGSSVEGSFVVADKEEAEKIVVQSPYTDESDLSTVLPDMMSTLVAGEMGGTMGVNVNQCSSSVMGGIPNLEPDAVQNVLQLQDRSGTSSDPNYLFPTWPLGVGAVSIEQMKAMMPFVAGRGTIFRAQIVGYSDTPGVYARAEVVIDASEELPRVVSWRDLTHLGLGFSLDTLTQ